MDLGLCWNSEVGVASEVNSFCFIGGGVAYENLFKENSPTQIKMY